MYGKSHSQKMILRIKIIFKKIKSKVKYFHIISIQKNLFFTRIMPSQRRNYLCFYEQPFRVAINLNFVVVKAFTRAKIILRIKHCCAFYIQMNIHWYRFSQPVFLFVRCT